MLTTNDTILASPNELKNSLPLTESLDTQIQQHRIEITDIVSRKDKRLLVVVGPCSIHDPKAAFIYAKQLATLAKQIADKIKIVMRVYFTKPRTTVGWKGLINDPHLDNTCDIPHGLQLTRQLLLDINQTGLAIACEFLNPMNCRYLLDTISWVSVGARSVESQLYREMASGLKLPVGFKNSTAGDAQIAMNAMQTAAYPHCFIGINDTGKPDVIKTPGNPHTHLILRGGEDTSNYSIKQIHETSIELIQRRLNPHLMIDCSHGNARAVDGGQLTTAYDVLNQIRQQQQPQIMGLMLESFLQGGRQPINTLEQLQHGQSVTDACLSWDETESLLRQLHEAYVL